MRLYSEEPVSAVFLLAIDLAREFADRHLGVGLEQLPSPGPLSQRRPVWGRQSRGWRSAVDRDVKIDFAAPVSDRRQRSEVES